ncbi:MAG: hypothetical protein GY765_10540 [bacterium]|nr:hypothetical protein [bacterium]
MAGLLLGAVPYFMVPFGIADLLHGVQPVAHYSHLEAVTAKVWAAVTTDTHASRVDLSVFYIRSLLAAGLSFFLLFSLLRCRRKWKNRPLSPPGEVPAGDVREPKPELGFWKRFNLFFAKRLEPLSPYVYGIFILTASVAVAVQAVSLPVNFGILLKPNVYPEVKVEAVHLLPDDCDKKKATKIWFLRGSDKRVLFYVGYYPSGAVGPRYAMTSILKEHIDRVEITGHSFVIQASKFIK